MEGKRPRIAFFGTPYVARDTFGILVDRGYAPAVVITSPDARKGRGLVLTPSETKAWALAKGFPVLSPEKLNAAAIAEIGSYGCGAGIVVAYGKLLPRTLIDAFPLGVLNVHYSLLPRYRGASPVESALLSGDATTGVSIQKMAVELDAGDILAQKGVPIAPEETTRELRPRLIAVGAEPLTGSLPAFLSGTVALAPQDGTKATFAKKISKEDGFLDLAGDAQRNWNAYRAFAESPGTYFFAERGGKSIRVKVTAAEFAGGEFRVTRVIPEGGREMNYADFRRNAA